MLGKSQILIATLVSVLFLTGCASTIPAQRDVSERSRVIGEKITQLQETAANQPRAQISTDVPWVSTQKIPFRVALPARFADRVVLQQPTPTSAQRILAKASEMTGLEFVIENDVFERRTREGGGSASPGGSTSDSALVAPAPVTEVGTSAVFRMGGGDDIQIALTHQGTIQSLLDALANAMRVNWRFDPFANRVVFFRFETRSFRMAMVPGATEVSSAVASSSTGAETGSKLSSSLDYWKSVREAVDAKISAEGAFTLSETVGLLTVRDRPDVLHRIEEYVSRVNDNFSRQVSIEVAVYRVSVNDSDRRALNFDLSFLNQAGIRGLNLTTPRPGATAGTLGSMVFTTPEGVASRWAGSSIFFDILSQLGQTSVVTTSTLNTINNQPAPLRVVRNIKYLKEVAQTASGNNVTATLTPGEVDVGFVAQVLPHVQDNGKDIVMQIMMTLSSLDRMDTFTSGGNSIQLPQVSSRDFLQRVWLRSGQSLVLVGFEHDGQGVDNSGMLGHQTWALGSNAATRSRERLVVVMTPVVRHMASAS